MASFRTFVLQRNEDVSGVSGTGVVAEGVEFTNGKTVIAWLGTVPSVVVYENIEQVTDIHGHGGKTVIKWTKESYV